MMLSSAKDSPQRSKTPASPAEGQGAGPRAPDRGNPDSDRDMGSALRSIYQRAVEEQIPDDLLSLLRKLD
jgi:hypothetical protein